MARKVEEGVTVSIELPISSAISEDYISDANLRMEVYRRIATRTENLDALREELSDRFGRLPDEVDRLLRLASIQRLAEALRVQSISTRRGALQVSLRRDAKVEVEELIRFVSEHPGSSFSPNGVLTLEGVAPAGLALRARGDSATLVERSGRWQHAGREGANVLGALSFRQRVRRRRWQALVAALAVMAACGGD